MEPSTAADLRAVRVRRAELRSSMNALEAALAAPAAGRTPAWGDRVRAALAAMGDDFAEHIAVTEGPDGLHQSILAGDLRLANAVAALTAEHAQLSGVIAELRGASETAVGPVDVDSLREKATQLLASTARHRQRGADLVYEAYETDIGGGD